MNKNGFTLIELLVVIAIIGVLSTIAMLNFNSTRSKARDSRRMQEFSSFMKGLDLYYDLHGMYPCGDAEDTNPLHFNVGGTMDGSGSGCDNPKLDAKGFLNGYGTVDCDGNAISGPSECPVHYSGLYGDGILGSNSPTDPMEKSSFIYFYQATQDRQSYLLSVYLEDSEEIMLNDGGFCSHYFELGGAVGEIRAWQNFACKCDGSGSNSICD